MLKKTIDDHKSKSINFKAVTSEAHTIKALFDAVYFYLKQDGILILSEEGIHLDGMDPEEKVSCRIRLHSHNFSPYLYRHKEDQRRVNIDLVNLNRLLKPIKKKDTIGFTIRTDDMDSLSIKITSKESAKGTHMTSRIPIRNAVPSKIVYPDGYGPPIILPAAEFQRVCRGMTGINNYVTISSNSQSQIRFYCNGDNLLEREGVFGNDNSDDDEEKSEVEEYNQVFSTAYISRIGKLASGLKNIRVYIRDTEGKVDPELPIRFSLAAGGIGELDFFLKSREQIVREENQNEEKSDGDEDE